MTERHGTQGVLPAGAHPSVARGRDEAMRKRRTKAPVWAIAAMVMAAACGGGDETTASEGPAAAPAEEAGAGRAAEAAAGQGLAEQWMAFEADRQANEAAYDVALAANLAYARTLRDEWLRGLEQYDRSDWWTPMGVETTCGPRPRNGDPNQEAADAQREMCMNAQFVLDTTQDRIDQQAQWRTEAPTPEMLRQMVDAGFATEAALEQDRRAHRRNLTRRYAG